MNRDSDQWISKPKSNFLPSLSNFSIQYNLAVAGIMVQFMTSHADDVSGQPDFPEPGWAEHALLGVVFGGAVVGMVCMGYLGDLIGRRKAMIVTLSCTAFGALGSAVLAWGTADSVYAVITGCRFILGVGVGGKYPLSAATAAEGSQRHEHASTRVGMAFFWQSPGAMGPYVVALMLLLLPATPWITSFQFRLLVGLGAIPAAIILVGTIMEEDDSGKFSLAKEKEEKAEGIERGHYFSRNLIHFKTLIGTGGTWFLFDVAYYGTAIFTPQIINNIFGDGTSLLRVCWLSLLTQTLGLPSAIWAIYLLKSKGAYWLNWAGFLLLSFLYALMALLYTIDADGLHELKFVVFCALTSALNWGPNVATYVLPTELFPMEVRGTFHGMSAASAKVGAVVGTFMYTPIRKVAGFRVVMLVQAVLMGLGFVCTLCFVPSELPEEHRRKSLADEDKALLSTNRNY